MAVNFVSGGDPVTLFYGNPKAEPTAGTEIEAVVTIRVGYSNGDFRQIQIYDQNDRFLASGSAPFDMLQDIQRAQ